MSAARVPTNAPGSVTAGAFNCSAIRVWWQPPMQSEGEGPIWGYRILYWPRISDCRSLDSDKARYQLGQRQTVHGEVIEGLIIGLDPDTYYCIAVQVCGLNKNFAFYQTHIFKFYYINYKKNITIIIIISKNLN